MEIIVFIALALIGGLAGLIAFCVAMKKGQFDDPEEPKYQLFREEENDA